MHELIVRNTSNPSFLMFRFFALHVSVSTSGSSVWWHELIQYVFWFDHSTSQSKEYGNLFFLRLACNYIQAVYMTTSRKTDGVLKCEIDG